MTNTGASPENLPCASAPAKMAVEVNFAPSSLTIMPGQPRHWIGVVR